MTIDHHAMRRQRNRDAGIPDMELGDRHEPCDYFAQVGFRWVLDRIGRAQPDHDWSEEGGYPEDRQRYLDARRSDHQRVADWLRSLDVAPPGNSEGAKLTDEIGDLYLTWPRRVPAIKVWAGQLTLAKIIKKLQKALPKQVPDIMAAEATVTGATGIDRFSAPTSLEVGFSLNGTNTKIVARVGVELLACLGLEQVPLLLYPDRRIGYWAGGEHYAFRVEPREQYYRRFGEAERTPFRLNREV